MDGTDIPRHAVTTYYVVKELQIDTKLWRVIPKPGTG
jgi:hypothetical protein